MLARIRINCALTTFIHAVSKLKYEFRMKTDIDYSKLC
jgi:hypothetical protein